MTEKADFRKESWGWQVEGWGRQQGPPKAHIQTNCAEKPVSTSLSMLQTITCFSIWEDIWLVFILFSVYFLKKNFLSILLYYVQGSMHSIKKDLYSWYHGSFQHLQEGGALFILFTVTSAVPRPVPGTYNLAKWMSTDTDCMKLYFSGNGRIC